MIEKSIKLEVANVTDWSEGLDLKGMHSAVDSSTDRWELLSKKPSAW